MKLLCDENIDRLIVFSLRQAGFDVAWIPEFARSVVDAVVLEIAATESRLLVTADHDFGDHVFRQRAISAGVVLVRLAGMSDVEKAKRVLHAIHTHGDEMLGNFSVIAANKLRIRASD